MRITPHTEPSRTGRPSRRRLAGVGIAALAALSIAAPQALASGQAAAHAKRPPKVHEVDYFKVSGEQGPATNLETFGRRIEALKYKAKYSGKKATAIAREYKAVESNRFGHPWIPDHHKGRRHLLNVLKASTQVTGTAELLVIAENDAGKTKTPVEIDLLSSDCVLEPPLYPFDCVIKP
jgi:hypothetical protein